MWNVNVKKIINFSIGFYFTKLISDLYKTILSWKKMKQ